jgi:hypothetical protein
MIITHRIEQSNSDEYIIALPSFEEVSYYATNMEFDASTIFLMIGCFLLGYFIDNLMQLLIGSKPLTSDEYAEIERKKEAASKKDIARRIEAINNKK